MSDEEAEFVDSDDGLIGSTRKHQQESEAELSPFQLTCTLLNEVLFTVFLILVPLKLDFSISTDWWIVVLPVVLSALMKPVLPTLRLPLFPTVHVPDALRRASPGTPKVARLAVVMRAFEAVLAIAAAISLALHFDLYVTEPVDSDLALDLFLVFLAVLLALISFYLFFALSPKLGAPSKPSLGCAVRYGTPWAVCALILAQYILLLVRLEQPEDISWAAALVPIIAIGFIGVVRSAQELGRVLGATTASQDADDLDFALRVLSSLGFTLFAFLAALNVADIVSGTWGLLFIPAYIAQAVDVFVLLRSEVMPHCVSRAAQFEGL